LTAGRVEQSDGFLATGENKAMAYWLFKEEPDHYSFADLERDKTTLWDGVTNNLARRNLRSVCRGDLAFFYHTGKEKAVVGEIRILDDPRPDPADPDPASVVVKVRPVRRLLHPVSLTSLKKEAVFAGSDLVRLPRLSVISLTDVQWQRVQALGRGG
jgi:predicted RNA-binding protein with PUA-like domain